MASRTFDVEDSPGPSSGNDRYLRRSWCAGMRGGRTRRWPGAWGQSRDTVRKYAAHRQPDGQATVLQMSQGIGAQTSGTRAIIGLAGSPSLTTRPPSSSATTMHNAPAGTLGCPTEFHRAHYAAVDLASDDHAPAVIDVLTPLFDAGRAQLRRGRPAASALAAGARQL